MRRIWLYSLVLALGATSWGCVARQQTPDQQAQNCEYVAPTGSHIVTLQCTPTEDDEERRSDDQEALRRAQRKDQMPTRDSRGGK